MQITELGLQKLLNIDNLLFEYGTSQDTKLDQSSAFFDECVDLESAK